MSIITKHRPNSFKKIVGNEATIESLQNQLDADTFPHAIEFTGPTGCGKTTLGRIIARKLGAKSADYIEIDTADFRGIDTIRTIRKQTRLRPSNPKSKCRVWLLDECHGLSKDAQNALLKALEDAPDHVYFILCTTDPQKLIPTLRGRCMPFTVESLSDDEMTVLLRRVCKKEKVKIPDEARETIIDQSMGQPRNALQLLGKIIGLSPEKMIKAIEEEAAKLSVAIDLARALIGGKKWKHISKTLKDLQNENEEGLRRMILGYCNSILLKKADHRVFQIMEEFENPFYNSGKPGLLLACYRSCHLE